MRNRGLVWGLTVAIASIGMLSRSAQATPVTYDLVNGNLSAFEIDGVSQLAGGPVALTDATATIDFAALEMSNIFVEASSVGFTLQNSTTPVYLTGGTPTYLVLDSPVAVTLGSTVFQGINLAGSTIDLGENGLELTMTGIASGGGEATVKIDFDFVARSTNGVTAIPEPGSELLFPGGLLLLGLIFRLQRNDAATC